MKIFNKNVIAALGRTSRRCTGNPSLPGDTATGGAVWVRKLDTNPSRRTDVCGSIGITLGTIHRIRRQRKWRGWTTTCTQKEKVT